MAGLTFQPLSDWQKRDCINQSAEFDCPNPATQEARLSNESGRIQAHVRCCEDKPCMARAEEMARTQFDILMLWPVEED